MSVYAVTGATSWGTTLAWLLARNGHDVRLVCRTEDEATSVRVRRGIARLPEVSLPDAVAVIAPRAIGSIDGIVIAVPAQSVRTTLSDVSWPRSVPVLCAAKGLELPAGLLLPAVLEELGWPVASIAVLSGPNLAHEIARGLPAASVVASTSSEVAVAWQESLSTETFRVYSSADVVGVSLAGALKNVIAIAAGAAAGLGYGTNAVATILTRGLAEITRLGIALGADPLTFQGLAGVGDLAATCFSPLSRNQRMGALVAAGRSPAEAIREIGEAVEGAATAPVAVALAMRHHTELPICAVVAAVIEGRLSVQEAAQALLRRPYATEARTVG